MCKLQLCTLIKTNTNLKFFPYLMLFLIIQKLIFKIYFDLLCRALLSCFIFDDLGVIP